MKKLLKTLFFIIPFAALCAGAIFYVEYIKRNIPDTIYMNAYSDGTINIGLPFVGTVRGEDGQGRAVEASVNLNEPVTINSGQVRDYMLSVRLFGIWDVKEIRVSVNEQREVVPCGIPVGIYIETDGVLVVDVGEISTSGGTLEAPAKGIVSSGDYITAVNGVEVNTISALVSEIDSVHNDYVRLTIRRGSELMDVKVKTVRDREGGYKIGVWVRDDCQGLGTLTYVDDNQRFGTLGHAISDSQTGQIVEIKSGSLYTAKIWSVVKGESGTPGEVIGSINYNNESYIGSITDNCEIGVYGDADAKIFAYVDEVYMDIAYKQDIEIGPATVRSFVGGDVCDYRIEIQEVNYSDRHENKGIIFEVVDEELLEATNGIVQGMSGSPIIQNGKVIGAVTHVFVNRPEKGYGIFIENMLEH
ncbi:MAG: SpoIVB peptidase [Butyrivibrio sp.]|nr:SpoIVB peptidase [Butyrivibrio sp.]